MNIEHVSNTYKEYIQRVCSIKTVIYVQSIKNVKTLQSIQTVIYVQRTKNVETLIYIRSIQALRPKHQNCYLRPKHPNSLFRPKHPNSLFRPKHPKTSKPPKASKLSFKNMKIFFNLFIFPYSDKQMNEIEVVRYLLYCSKKLVETDQGQKN